MAPQIKKEGTPAILYRNAIDLNRFSNGVQNRLVKANKKVLVRAIEQLAKIDDSEKPSYKAARLRALLKQTKESLGTWRKESVAVMIKELEGIADVQAGFVESQIEKALPSGVLRSELNPAGYSVQTVAVSPDFAKAVVTKDPSVVTLRATGPFDLTAAQGAQLTLPNGDTVEKAFRGIASRELSNFKQTVRTGLLSGEPTEDIVRQLMGNLEFGQRAGTPLQAALSGDAGFKMARHQIRTVVRTSVNQVSNAASKQVYKANEDVTEKYRYVATLDSRTSALCASLDGQEFEYDKGPEPPQHFNCRSTTVAVIDWDGLRKKYPKLKFDDPAEGKRAATGGMVPADTTYGKWLHGQRAKTKSGKLSQFTPGPRQIEALGEGKAKYFNRLAKKYGPDEAIKKFVRTDGTEISLAQLQKRYPKLTSITASKPTIVIKNQKQLEKFAEAARAAQAKETFTVGKIHSTQAVEAYVEKFGGIEKMTIETLKNLEAEGGLTAQNSKKMRKFLEKSNQVNNFAMSGERWNKKQVKRYSKKVIEDQLKTTQKAFDAYPESLKFEDSRKFFEYSKKAIKEGDEKAYVHVLKNILKPCGKTYSGYTTACSSVVNTKLRETSRLLTKKDIKEFKKAAKGILDQKARDLSNPLKEYIFKEKKLPSVSAAQDRDISWLSTMIHEIGHQVHFKGSGGAAYPFAFDPKAMTYVTKYASKNRFEQFAEAFTVYVLDPEGLQLKAPKLYQWVDDNLEKALKLL
tara:strand:+ start:3117 stop:5351 length:2235 start_codon:yes stop_codon:yes gene_type:complete